MDSNRSIPCKTLYARGKTNYHYRYSQFAKVGSVVEVIVNGNPRKAIELIYMDGFIDYAPFAEFEKEYEVVIEIKC